MGAVGLSVKQTCHYVRVCVCDVAGIGTKIICHDMSYYTDNFADLPQDDRVIMLVRNGYVISPSIPPFCDDYHR